jgi:putative protein-disulfide isomerase
MLFRLQVAHYVEGRHIAERQVLVEKAGVIGPGVTYLTRALSEVEDDDMHLYIAESRRLMEYLVVQRFPGFALEHDGRTGSVDASAFLSHPEALQDRLQTWLSEARRIKRDDEFGHWLDSCLM